MIRRLLGLLLGGALLAGCATAPTGPMPQREQVDNFALEARFALRMTAPDSAPRSAGGRLSWAHKNGSNRILISNPLGVGLAEIETTTGQSRLHTADGKFSESSDPDALMEEATGQRLPVARLPGWLLARPGDGHVVRDERGRPTHLEEAGWQIDYAYEDPAPGALPSRLTLSREREIELRLRIEEWKLAP